MPRQHDSTVNDFAQRFKANSGGSDAAIQTLELMGTRCLSEEGPSYVRTRNADTTRQNLLAASMEVQKAWHSQATISETIRSADSGIIISRWPEGNVWVS